MKFIVFAGGQGTKLWPLSRENKPKQFQPVVGEKTLFRENIDALLSAYEIEDIFVATKKRYVEYVVKDAPEILMENIIIEPDIAKNTGPATGLAILKLSLKFPEEPFMIVQADCIRTPDTKFVEMIKVAEKLVREEKKLVTGGQKAQYPDMGIDYLMLGDQLKNYAGIDVFKIEKFIPRMNSYQETEKLISEVGIATHSNHYCWYPNLMLETYQKYRPDWYQSLMEIKVVMGKENEEAETEKIYEKMETGTAEEVTKHIFSESYIIINPFQWLDMGTWGVVYEYLASNDEVYFEGNVLAINSKNSLIKSTQQRLIAAIGIDNLLVVDTEDALLICPKSLAQEVQKIIVKLKEEGKHLYL